MYLYIYRYLILDIVELNYQCLIVDQEFDFYNNLVKLFFKGLIKENINGFL